MGVQWKDLFREIRKNFGRFISIFFIVLLGTAMFAGLRASSVDMKLSADTFYDEQDMMDFRVAGTLGLTDEDLTDIQNTEGVEAAVGVKTADVLVDTQSTELVVHAIQMTDGINTPYVTEGRLPEADDEIFVDEQPFKEQGYQVGDTVTVSFAGSDDEPLSRTEFTISGMGSLPYYTDEERGDSTIGDGSVDAFIVAMPDVFTADIWSEIDLTVSGAKALSCYGDEYDSLMDTMQDRLETLGETDAKRRYDSVYQDALDSVNSAQDEVDSRRQEIADGQQALDDAQSQLDAQKAQLEAAQAAYGGQSSALAAQQQQIADAQSELDAQQSELDDSTAQLDDAQAEVDSARDDLENIGESKWYVLDRSKIESCESYRQNAERMMKLGQVLPIMFFLVAALVALTAMTRMVDEQRGQIGIMKALGYDNGSIAARYLAYAMLATVGGGAVGILFGEKFLPSVIVQAYGKVYPGLPLCLTPIIWSEFFLALLCAVGCTGIATLAACYVQMRAVPAELMRPEAPKNGRRVMLERIPAIWSRLNFTRKATVRNLMRYKKRFYMTIIGIGGCMGLLLVGFGFRDSISEIMDQQYSVIHKYQAEVTIDSDASDEERAAFIDCVKNQDGITGTALVCEKSPDVLNDDQVISVSLIVPASLEQVSDFIGVPDRKTGEAFSFPDSGAAIDQKAAELLGVAEGDTVTLQEDGYDEVQVKIVEIARNYMQHYLYMSPDAYSSLYGEEPQYNTILLQYDDFSQQDEQDLANSLMAQDACGGVTFVSDEKTSVDQMLGILNSVMYIIIIASGMLAFVVLYNLNSINITERKRELATFKVLGFYDREVAQYIYRENTVLTAFGILFGLVFGTVLHHFVIGTVETELIHFGRTISLQSYLICAGLTVVFTIIVNLVMNRMIRKIDMIESLKSVE